MKFFKDHSLSIVLFLIFIVMTGYTLWTGPELYRQEQLAHGEPYKFTEFMRWWSHEYVLSNLADVFGAILLVLLTKKLYERGSSQS